MDPIKLKEILENHKKWLLLGVGQKANLSGAYLSRADLSWANLSRADLSGANLYEANLAGANLSGADLSGANLYGADLPKANLSGADLSGANLSRADLSWANIDKGIWASSLGKYFVTFLPEGLKIGCEGYYPIEKWKSFTKEKISQMDQGAWEWWVKYKPVLLAIHKAINE